MIIDIISGIGCVFLLFILLLTAYVLRHDCKKKENQIYPTAIPATSADGLPMAIEVAYADIFVENSQ